MYSYHYLVVGAGLSGLVIAERISNVLNENVLIIEKREHIGGNCFDYYDNYGVLVQKYGPHIFHTNSELVWNYISKFTGWHYYLHKVLVEINGEKIPLPFNLNSLHMLLKHDKASMLEEKLIKYYGYKSKVSIWELKRSTDSDLVELADLIYQNIFLNYTVKQWGLKPEELNLEVMNRIPVYISHDNNYFTDKFQGIPEKGYTAMLEKMISNEKVKVLLNTDFFDLARVDESTKKIFIQGKEFSGKIIYTGMIDEFFNYCYGPLPYRSLRFEFETYEKDYYQEVGVVNYPNNFDFTRITEFKHLTGQISKYTTIAKEYPQVYNKDLEGCKIPYYPILTKESSEIYQKYAKKAEEFNNIYFIGRLGEYRYLNMDQVIERALQIFEEMNK